MVGDEQGIVGLVQLHVAAGPPRVRRAEAQVATTLPAPAARLTPPNPRLRLLLGGAAVPFPRLSRRECLRSPLDAFFLFF